MDASYDHTTLKCDSRRTYGFVLASSPAPSPPWMTTEIRRPPRGEGCYQTSGPGAQPTVRSQERAPGLFADRGLYLYVPLLGPGRPLGGPGGPTRAPCATLARLWPLKGR